MLTLALAMLAVVVLGYRWKWTWTGFPVQRYAKHGDEDIVPRKTLWDWMQLLFIPAVLFAGAFLLNTWQSAREEVKIEAQRQADKRATLAREEQAESLALDNQREQALQRYLDAMTSLILENHLPTSTEGADVRTVARTLTLTTLQRLDGERRGAVVRFLYEANLIFRSGPRPDSNCPFATARLCYGFPTIVDLSGANLVNADLHGAFLDGVNLPEVDLEGANLASAILPSANLVGSNVDEANLTSATLYGAYIDRTQFDGSDLRDTVFADAEGSCTDFRRSLLSSTTSFSRVDLLYGNFSYTELTKVDFSNARLLGVNFSFSTAQESPNFRGAKGGPWTIPSPPWVGKEWDSYCGEDPQ